MNLPTRLLSSSFRSLLGLTVLAFTATVPRSYSAETAPAAPAAFQFTVTSDLHDTIPLCTYVFDAVKAGAGGLGDFMISIGDIVDHDGQTPQNLRDLIDSRFGKETLWWTVPGNHDTHSSYAMAWLRDEFTKGHNKHAPLQPQVLRPGPVGCAETTYSFDHGSVHFVMLNEYWNGKNEPGSDYATGGDIVPALREWLETDLKATDKPFVFVYGHEPAFPQHRHVGDSLDQYAENRDAFWALLAKYKVQAFFSGHIHYYYKELKDGVYQISDGAAGKNVEGHQTYLKIVAGEAEVRIEAWQNDVATPASWHIADAIVLKPRLP